MTVNATTDAVLSNNNLIQAQFDISLDSDGDILTDDWFDTAILVSLFAEKRASASEMSEPDRRRGWIGNEFTPNFEIGSKIWLLSQARLTQSTLNSLVTYARDGLAWLVNQGFAVRTEVFATSINNTAVLDIKIERPYSKVEKRFFILWENSGDTKIDPINGASVTL